MSLEYEPSWYEDQGSEITSSSLLLLSLELRNTKVDAHQIRALLVQESGFRDFFFFITFEPRVD